MTLRRSFFALCAAGLALASPFARATAEDAVAVAGPWITLGDVADASGPLALVRVAPSPAAGESLSLDPGFVGRIARDNGVYFPEGRTAPVRITRVSGVQPLTQPQAAAAAPVPAAQPVKPDFQDKPPAPDHVLVPTRDVQRGEILTASDLIWTPPDGRISSPSGAPRLMSDAIGKETRRTLRAEHGFRLSDLQERPLVRKGEPVTLVYASAGLRLSVSGKALGDAGQGEPVRILNNYSKRSIDAIATGAGEARVSAQ